MKPNVIDAALLDSVSEQARQSPRRRKNYNFHATDTDAAHRLLNAVEPGSYIPPHRHNDPTKDESILILRGRLGALFFDEEGKVTAAAVLEPGGAQVGINVPHGTYHTVIALEAGTVFFEAKAGPYVPLAPAERAPWAPVEGGPGAAEYLAKLILLFPAA